MGMLGEMSVERSLSLSLSLVSINATYKYDLYGKEDDIIIIVIIIIAIVSVISRSCSYSLTYPL